MTDERHAIPDELQTLDRALDHAGRTADVVAARLGTGGRQAAVLALFATGDEGPSVVVTERAATLRKHAGQVAFPGGARDATDLSLEFTALREASEEIGLNTTTVQTLGRLPAAHVAVSRFDVTTVVGWWRHPHPIGAVDVAEVASVHQIPVSHLVDPANRRTARHPSGYRGPAFVADDLFIWGLTAHLLEGLLQLGGWDRDWDRDHVVEVPERFLRDRASRTHGGTGLDAH